MGGHHCKYLQYMSSFIIGMYMLRPELLQLNYFAEFNLWCMVVVQDWRWLVRGKEICYADVSEYDSLKHLIKDVWYFKDWVCCSKEEARPHLSHEIPSYHKTTVGFGSHCRFTPPPPPTFFVKMFKVGQSIHMSEESTVVLWKKIKNRWM